jgi:hypothetical protein
VLKPAQYHLRIRTSTPGVSFNASVNSGKLLARK